MNRWTSPFRLSRRDFVRLSAAASALPAADSLLLPRGISAAQEEASGPIVVAGWGGRFTEASRTYLAEPFTQETGIEVQFVDAPGEQLSRVLAQKNAGKIEWDLMDAVTASDSYVAFDQGLAAKLPADLKTKFDGMLNVVNDYGFAFAALGDIIACNTEEAEACPTTPAEFWDVEQFPGPRVLCSFLPLEVLTFASLGAGTPKDELFPLDLDLAFSKLEEIRPHVTVWYTSGDQSEQVFRDGEVVMGQIWSGRAYNVLDQGVPLQISWEQGVYEPGFWFALEGAPHQAAAFQFLDWIATHPEDQAKWATEMRYAPANPEAFDYMDEETAKRLADYPENFEKLIVPDWQWYAENSATIQERWNEFLAG